MKKMKNEMEFGVCLNRAIDAINKLEFDQAKEIIMEAMAMNTGAPEPHNLLGILAEYESDRQLAAKHYRASNALDPTYMPAQNNLARVTSSNGFVMKPRDLGRPKRDENESYYVEFDSQNVGHIKKKAIQ